MPNLEPGALAPSFALPRDGQGSVSLSDYKGRKLVLYFYPKDDTSGCTAEAIAFNGLRGRIRQGRRGHSRRLPRSDETTRQVQGQV